MRCLSRLIEPTAGGIRFEGRDLLAMTEAEMIGLRRSRMGMVFQHFALLPHLTVLENVAFPLEVQGLPRVQRGAAGRSGLWGWRGGKTAIRASCLAGSSSGWGSRDC